MTFVYFTLRSLGRVILSPRECCALSEWAETARAFPSVISALAVARAGSGGNPVFGPWIPGLALLARNDELVVFVIPAKAGIQEVWCGLGILFLSSGAKNLSERPFVSLRVTTLVCQFCVFRFSSVPKSLTQWHTFHVLTKNFCRQLRLSRPVLL